MKIYKCKYCDYQSNRKSVREHVRKNHYWKGGGALKGSHTSREFK